MKMRHLLWPSAVCLFYLESGCYLALESSIILICLDGLFLKNQIESDIFLFPFKPFIVEWVQTACVKHDSGFELCTPP